MKYTNENFWQITDEVLLSAYENRVHIVYKKVNSEEKQSIIKSLGTINHDVLFMCQKMKKYTSIIMENTDELRFADDIEYIIFED